MSHGYLNLARPEALHSNVFNESDVIDGVVH